MQMISLNIIYEKAKDEYEAKIKEVPVEVSNEFEKALSLQVIDNYWMEQINVMSHLREGIYLQQIWSRRSSSSLYYRRI